MTGPLSPPTPPCTFVFFDAIDVQELMGSLLWAGRLEESPYSHLLSADLWTRVKEAVVVDGSRVSGLSRESILSVAFRVSVRFICTFPSPFFGARENAQS